MKKLVLILTLVTSTLSFSKKVVKDNIPNYRAYVVGDNKGNIFYQENALKIYPLASLTKVMTIIVTLDEVRKGNVSLYDEVPIDWEILSVGGSSIPMQSGEKITVLDLLKSAAIKSANNAAYALAKHSGKGSIPRFVDMMNEKAKSLGLENDLVFYTPAGLPDHMTKKKLDTGTALGIYKLSMEALKYPEYIAIARQKTAEIKNGEYKLRSTIRLLDKEGVYGLKTGYHTKSRFNIAVLSDKNDANLITVVMGGKTSKIRDEKILELNEKVYEDYKNKNIIKKDVPLLSIPVVNGYTSDVEIYGTKSYSKIVKKDDNILIQTDREKKISAPIKAGTVIGTYKVLINGEVTFTDELIVKKDIEKKKVFDKIMDFF